MNRREFLKLATTATGVCLLDLPRIATVTGQQPNIIWVMADDLGYGDLGCYGQQIILTPNIDAMAAEGLRFTQAYSAAPVCSPARWCLLTGHNARALPSLQNNVRLRAGDVTITQVLKAAGYATAGIGKWALADPNEPGLPWARGFDHWYGYLHQGYAHNYYPHFLWRDGTTDWLKTNWTGNVDYSHDLFVGEALQLLANTPSPYFLYLPLTLPHANNELAALTGDGMQVPGYGSYVGTDWPQPERGFAAMVTMLDAAVGCVLDAVRGTDTLVFFTSDNGPHSAGGHDAAFFDSAGGLRGGKADLYEGGIRVPMIAWWPGVIQPGTSNYMWSFTDFMATAADLAGVVPPANDGVSIAPVLTQSGTPAHPPFYWHFLDIQAGRENDWKVVQNGSSPPELYDLAADPGETTNLAAIYPGLAEEILQGVIVGRKVFMPYWDVP